MRMRFGLAFGLTILSSAALAETTAAPGGTSPQSAILQAPRVPGATIAGPKRPDVETEPLATDDRQAQGYGRRDLRDQSGNDDEDDNDNDRGDHGSGRGRNDHGHDWGRGQDTPMWHHRMMSEHMGGMGGGMGGRMGMMNQHRPAFFIMRAGENRLVVRCGPDESTKTCIDAMMPLLDKLHAMAPNAPSTTAPQPPSTPR